MVLRRIGREESENYEVPWINDFLMEGGTIGDSSIVTTVVKSTKGYIVICEDYKGFLFNGSSILKFLEAALSVWVSREQLAYPLYGIAGKEGKIELAVDDEELPTDWIETKKSRTWEQRRKKSLESSSKLETSNPFLLTPPPTSNGRKATKSRDMPTIPSSMS